VLEENNEINLIDELDKSEDKDDIRFIVLILEQLKLKVNIIFKIKFYICYCIFFN
jgi:hypothetical protein